MTVEMRRYAGRYGVPLNQVWAGTIPRRADFPNDSSTT
jgi:hypothetical protein